MINNGNSNRETKHSSPPAASGCAEGIKELAQHWLRLLENSGRAAESTVRSYEVDLGQFVSFLEKQDHSLRPVEIAPMHVVRFRDSKPDWKPATVKRKLCALKSFFEWLVEHGHVETNPAASVARPQSTKSETNYVTGDEALSMLLQCRDDRERAIFMTFWRAALRYSELQDLRIGDVDLSRNELRVKGKGGHVATVPILSDLRPYLVRWLQVRPDVDHDYLFTSRTGAPMYDKCARRLIQRLIDHAGLSEKGYTPHSLRHGCATELYEAGVDLGTVARFLRHRDMSTVNRYVHGSTDRIRREIEDKLGLEDASALNAFNEAQTEALVERIAARVADRLRSGN